MILTWYFELCLEMSAVCESKGILTRWLFEDWRLLTNFALPN